MQNNTNNYFIIQERQYSPFKKFVIHFINRVLVKAGFWHQIIPVFNPMVEMSTIEHRINYYHLLTKIISQETDGDLVEFGCFTGQCAMLFQQILNVNDSDKILHLYDSFEKKFGLDEDIEDLLKKNFSLKGLKQPVIHKGLFSQTIPAQLPDKISFAHIDCGWGGDPNEHKDIVLYCLENIYDRLGKGAICVLMDYHDPDVKFTGLDCNPGVKMACDAFFFDKPEKIISLYANEASHAYFTKL